MAACSLHSNAEWINATRLSTAHASLPDCCTQCGTNSKCVQWNWHPLGKQGQPPQCYLFAAGGTLESTPSSQNFTSGTVTTRPPMCATEMDCSLAGACDLATGKCVCDGWTHGDHCEVLNLLPAKAEAFGYWNSSGYNSWGGASVEYNGKWYLFASQIINKCPLAGHWNGGSEGVRLTSTVSPMGPWTDLAVILPHFAHNIKPYRAPDGTWVVYYIGNHHDDKPGQYNCSSSHLKIELPNPIGSPGGIASATAGPIMVASASSPDAEPSAWTIHGPLTDNASFTSSHWSSATNPSAFFFPNGSVLLAVSRSWGRRPSKTVPGDCWGKRTVFMFAETFSGPFRNISAHDATGHVSCHAAFGSGEDPDLFRTKRGWHMLSHNTGKGSTELLYAEHYLGNWSQAGTNAFNMTVQWTNGTTSEVCSRQRPQMQMGSDGTPAYFWTGVGHGRIGDPNCEMQATWTLAQGIGRPALEN